MSAHDESPECQLPYGQVCWFEVPVYDIQRASRLYAEVFDWKMNPEPRPMALHGIKTMHMFTTRRKDFNGAFLAMEDGYHMTRYGKLDKEILPPLATFCVEDCEETLKQVGALGGRTQCPKTAIGHDQGYFARFLDSEGNVMGIWSQN
ncbi:hypothetical protein E4U42_000860 [Claviceps africana]|uniref:VOC domain-containing protein n=1 Tax=Claviceps africana TaxID=83212 RepID=A0A8K0NI95_9HYPO|nr:hypothetical protein E4U42_000860 [Claviceps africana]